MAKRRICTDKEAPPLVSASPPMFVTDARGRVTYLNLSVLTFGEPESSPFDELDEFVVPFPD